MKAIHIDVHRIDVRFFYGYACASCTCGWSGTIRGSATSARREGEEHLEDHR